MTKNLLNERDFGRNSQFEAVWARWKSCSSFMTGRQQISGAYQASLGVRRTQVVLDARFTASCRNGSVAAAGQRAPCGDCLITDLLRLEENAERAADGAKATWRRSPGDPLLSGVRELGARPRPVTKSERTVAPKAMRAALDRRRIDRCARPLRC
jgi:hypothetical protein